MTLTKRHERSSIQRRAVSELLKMQIDDDKDTLGTVQDVFLDVGDWHARHLGVERGSLFNKKTFAVPTSRCKDVDWDARCIHTDFEPADRSALTCAAPEPVSEQFEKQRDAQFGWPLARIAPRQQVITPRQSRDNTIRSADELRGYKVKSRGNDIGPVRDILIDLPAWKARFLVVDAREWFPERDVLVPVSSVIATDWKSQTIAIDIDKQSIEGRTVFEPPVVLGEQPAHAVRF